MTKDPFPLRRVDHVRFFVGNARQSAYFYRNAFGFDVDRLRRPGNQDTSTRPATSCGRATSPSCWPRRCGRNIPRASGSSSTATACRTSPSKWTTCAAAYRRWPSAAAPSAVAPPTLLEDEHRRLRIRHHPHLRRHHAQLRQPRPLSRRLRPGLQAARSGTLQPAHLPARRPARPSTTSSATSRKARWTSGSSSTRTCSASRSSSTSTTRTSAPNIPP